MKIITKSTIFSIIFTTFISFGSVFSFADEDHSMHMQNENHMNHSGNQESGKSYSNHQHMQSTNNVHTAKGKVISIDKKSNKVEIAHEPVPSLNWPAMTMRFMLENSALLENIKSGDTISFDFQSKGKDFVIVDIISED